MKKKLLIMLFCALALTGCKQKTIEEKTADLANLFIESLDSSTIDTGALEDEEISTYYEFINSQTEKSYIVNLTEIKIFDNAATTKDKDTGGIYEENGNLFIKYTDIPFIKDGEDFSAKLVYNGQETTIYKSLLPLLYINTSGIDKYKYEFMYHEVFDEKLEYYYRSTYDDSGLIIRFYTENDKISNIYMIYEDKYSYEEKKEEVKRDYTKYYAVAGIILVVIILLIVTVIILNGRKQ